MKGEKGQAGPKRKADDRATSIAGKRPKVKVGIRRPEKEDIVEESAQNPVELVPMEVTPLRQHPPPEGSSRRDDARREATPKKGVPSPSSAEILVREDELIKARVPEASHERAKEDGGRLSFPLHFITLPSDH